MYLKNWYSIINVGMIRCASSEDRRADCPTYGITEIGTTFNVMGNFWERKFFKSESLKTPFPALSGR